MSDRFLYELYEIYVFRKKDTNLNCYIKIINFSATDEMWIALFVIQLKWEQKPSIMRML